MSWACRVNNGRTFNLVTSAGSDNLLAVTSIRQATDINLIPAGDGTVRLQQRATVG